MNIELLKKYQELDKNYSEFSEKVKNTEQYINYENSLKDFSKKQKEIQDTKEEIKRLCASLPECEEKKNTIQLSLDDIQSKVSQSLTLDEVDNIYKKIKKIEDDIYDLMNYEKCLNKLILCEDKNKDNFNQLIFLNKECKSLRDEFGSIYNQSKDVFLKPIETEMKNLCSQLTKEEIATYESLKNSVEKYPYIVDYDGEFCGGCGEDISSEVTKFFTSKDVTCRCPRCQRLLYLK